MSDLATIGVTGLAVMGATSPATSPATGTPSPSTTARTAQDRALVDEHGHEGTFVPAESTATTSSPRSSGRAGASSWSRPGRPTDAVIDELAPLLEEGDIVVDGGNADFQDTRRRERRLREQGLHFVGAGISGGEEGALHGPVASCRAGSDESYAALGPDPRVHRRQGRRRAVLRLHRSRRRRSLRQDGAQRHRVRRHAVHRGGVRRAARRRRLTAAESPTSSPSGTPASSSRTSSRSPPRCSPRDAATGGPLVDVILDRAGQKGTGRWTVQNALELGVPVSAIAEAVFARAVSATPTCARRPRGGTSGPDRDVAPGATDRRALVDDVRGALYAVQGRRVRPGLRPDPRRPARSTAGTSTSATVARIWRGGCIIRARLLDRIGEAYDERPDLATLLAAPCFADGLADAAGRVAARRRAGRDLGRPRARLLLGPGATTTRSRRAAAGRADPGAARLLRRPHLRPHRPRGRLPHAVVRRPLRGLRGLIHPAPSAPA